MGLDQTRIGYKGLGSWGFILADKTVSLGDISTQLDSRQIKVDRASLLLAVPLQ